MFFSFHFRNICFLYLYLEFLSLFQPNRLSLQDNLAAKNDQFCLFVVAFHCGYQISSACCCFGILITSLISKATDKAAALMSSIDMSVKVQFVPLVDSPSGVDCPLLAVTHPAEFIIGVL